MNHDEAVRLKATEKYVLGELPEQLRDEYEEHCFDCAQCALDLKAAAAFTDTAREVLRQEATKPVAMEAVPARGGWFAWLKPVVAVPALAALLLIVLYQNTLTIPRAKEEAAVSSGQMFTSSFSLQMGNTRGGEEVKLQIHPNENFALKFDFTPARSFDSYIWQLQEESGRSVLEGKIPGSSANKEAQLVVPGGRVKPGKYALAFMGTSDSSGKPAGSEVLRFRFAIEFLQ